MYNRTALWGEVNPVLSQNQRSRAGWILGTSIQQSVCSSEGLRTRLKIHCNRLRRHTATRGTLRKNLNPDRRTGKNDSGCMAQMMCTSCVGCSQVNKRTVIRRALVSQSHRLAHQGSIAFVCWHRRNLWRPTDCLFEMPINANATLFGWDLRAIPVTSYLLLSL